jgi:hypothetical protein
MNEGTGRVRIEERTSGIAVVREERSQAAVKARRLRNQARRSRRLRRATGGSQGQATWIALAKEKRRNGS